MELLLFKGCKKKRKIEKTRHLENKDESEKFIFT